MQVNLKEEKYTTWPETLYLMLNYYLYLIIVDMKI